MSEQHVTVQDTLKQWRAVNKDRINKSFPRSGLPASPKGIAFFALVFGLVGFFVMLAGLGVIPTENSDDEQWLVITMSGSLFFSFGLWCSASAFRRWRHLRKARAKSPGMPHEPWRWDHPWDERRVNDRGYFKWLRQTCAFGILTIFMTIPVLIIWDVLDGEFVPELPFIHFGEPVGFSFQALIVGAFVSVFSLITLWCWWYSSVSLVRLLVHGRGQFLFERFPYFVGEEFRGHLKLSRFGAKFRALNCTVHLVEERIVKSGDSTSVAAYALWSQEIGIDPSHSQAHSQLVSTGTVPLALKIPGNLHGNELVSEKGCHYWELVVRGRRLGVDYRGEFLLPIYSREDISRIGEEARDERFKAQEAELVGANS